MKLAQYNANLMNTVDTDSLMLKQQGISSYIIYTQAVVYRLIILP